MSPLGLPPDDLSRFPAFGVDRRRSLYRIHRTDAGPWWFSGDGSGRFDLRDGRGSCYLAVTPVGAFIEVFRVTTVIPEAEVEARSLSSLVPPTRARLADCTVSAARKFGAKEIEASWVLEDNRSIVQPLEDQGFLVTDTYGIYERAI